MGNSGSIQYSLGLDATALSAGFAKALRFTGDFTDKVKKAMSVRGMFDGLMNGMKSALGGQNLGQIITNSIESALAKDTVKQSFEGLFNNDALRAGKTLQDLRAFADDAGFTAGEVIESARGLIASGHRRGSEAVEDLKMLGDVARGSGAQLSSLAQIYEEMAASGEASTRTLQSFGKAGIDVTGAIADSMKNLGKTREDIKKMAEEGKLSFETVSYALKSMTGAGGKFQGQIDRWRNSLGGLADDAKSAFGKIPTAFFSGIIGQGTERARVTMAQIRDILSGWVVSARAFGEDIGAAISVIRELQKGGNLWSTLASGLAGAGIGLLNLLMNGFAAIASGFASALSQAMDELGDKMAEVLSLGVKKAPKGAGDRITGAFTAGRKAGFKQDAVSIPNPAADSFFNMVQPMFDAAKNAQWAPDEMREKLAASIGAGVASAFSGIALPLATLQEEGDGPRRGGRRADKGGGGAPDDLARIGGFIGAGGPQGEAHAKKTAKNTESADIKLGKIETHLRDMKKRGLATF